MDLPSILAAFFRREAPLAPADGLVVAFSGGPDSTALLWGLSRLAAGGSLPLTAAHLDHGMDPGSAGRAAAAARLAHRLRIPFVMERREVPALRRPAESAEAAARRVRYEFLEEVRARAGARWIATAHHRDDQAETVLLRLLFGSGLAGVAGIRPVHGRVVRPLLEVSRAELAAALSAGSAGSAGSAAGLSPVEDPTNLDPRTPRNRVRHGLLPALEAAEGELAPCLARLAERARGAAAVLESRLAPLLGAETLRGDGGGVAVERGALERLPAELLPFAFAALHRQAGAPYPAGGAARSEVLRQLAGRTRAGCDCGGGWRWEQERERLILRRTAPHSGRTGERVTDFTYTLEVPGELDIPEIA
ncbi:MAG TPA: tRNA lysidine(34) synthetase TilS, partial [Thermoanaerobaculia bacterium]|nr:tRNA lysidine(34) synthetase TilS [Thermoanaerobaculia bacterium]